MKERKGEDKGSERRQRGRENMSIKRMMMIKGNKQKRMKTVLILYV